MSLLKASDCCLPCDSPATTQIPGPAGAAGADGTNGAAGLNAYTSLTASFVMPAELGSVVATVGASAWATIGQVLVVQSAGEMEVVAKPSPTSLTLLNLEDTPNDAYPGNAAPGVVIPNGSTVSPGGLQGPVGAAGAASLDAISPTTTKGDMLIDDGANNPNASVQRIAAGANGTRLVADSTQALGARYAKVTLSDTAEVTGATGIAQGGTGQVTANPAFNALSPVMTRGDIIVRNATVNARLAIGAVNTVLKTDGVDPSWGKVTGDMMSGRVATDVILVQEQQTLGTAGGGFTAGAWRTRALNTEVFDTGNHAAVAGSQITLQAGTYRIRAWATANRVDLHVARFYNISDSTVAADGSSNAANNADFVSNMAIVEGRFTIASAKIFELQHWCSTTQAVNGFGLATVLATEIYSSVYLEREAG